MSKRAAGESLLLTFPKKGYPYPRAEASLYRAILRKHGGTHDGWEMFDKRLFYWWGYVACKRCLAPCRRALRAAGFATATVIPTAGRRNIAPGQVEKLLRAARRKMIY